MSPAAGLVLLDTNILVRLIRNDSVAQRLEADHQLTARRERPLVSEVTSGEIRALALKWGWGSGKLERLDDLLRQVVQVRISQGTIIETYAEIEHHCARIEKPARPIGQNDIWIAATASVTKATLFTTDKDFDHLDPKFLRVVRVDASSGESLHP